MNDIIADIIVRHQILLLLVVAAIMAGVFLWCWKRKFCIGHSLNLQDGIQITFLGVTALSLALIVLQVEKSAQSNLAATRGQLYVTESSLAEAESEKEDEDNRSLLSSIYVTLAPTYSKENYQSALMGLIGGPEATQKANSANALYTQLYGYEAFRDLATRKDNADARKVFLHIQDIFYHVHNAHDYWKNGILTEEEWKTWKVKWTPFFRQEFKLYKASVFPALK